MLVELGSCLMGVAKSRSSAEVMDTDMMEVETC
jgi:hypothetical protein